ncbi:TIGR01440 family protein [Anoxybacillus sp. J5B_2022]|uniref:TIGR01440 family protein n=1 Tax=Anoxybacillus sp. J5B_2022 TaxID=3003246 RepID=UPI00228634D1|nr:TIGR01440 family protein [Anoxybacillus sp. J5B_2022]MCZ0754031.1 TIGR01440 family protein [Anoxybacillus sp. J5B_2022]
MLSEWKQQWQTILAEFKQQAPLSAEHLLVIGCSTSEVIGKKIGTAGSTDVAEMIFSELKKWRDDTGVQLAFQCCEHLNRALVVEKETALAKQLEIVSVIPVRSAGGAMAEYAYNEMNDPVVVEFVKADAGIDIGDTLIGMHLKHVAVPVRTSIRQIGHAHVTLAKTRPKLIGGARAVYSKENPNASCTFS